MISVRASASAASVNTNDVTTAAINALTAALLLSGRGAYVPGTPPVASDSSGNSWTALTSQIDNNTRLKADYVANPVTSGSHTFTGTGTGSYPSIAAAAVMGALLASPLDQQSGAVVGVGTSLQPGSLTPSKPNCGIFSWLVLEAIKTPAIDSGFSILQHINYVGGVNYGIDLAWTVQGVATAVNPTWSWSGATRGVANMIVILPGPLLAMIEHAIGRGMHRGMTRGIR